jgi:phosphoglycerate kinase
MMHKLTLQDLPLKGKKVLMRVDFNVPLNKDGTILDDTRIQEALPSIQYALNQGAGVILMSHLGRPKAKKDPTLSLGIVAKKLSQFLSAPVFFATDCVGKEVEKMAHDLKGGEVLLLENLRFYPAEEEPETDPTFAKQLASLADFYVNDAFGTAHRAHTSTATIAQYFPGKAALGLLIQKELAFFEPLLHNPKRPFYALIGGAKVSTKIGILKALMTKVDRVFIGGAMSTVFLKAQGISMGNSLCEESFVSVAKELLNHKIVLPIDLVIAQDLRPDATFKIIDVPEGVPPGWQSVDIGPKTVAAWTQQLSQAATLFWNGPFGVFEIPLFARGTHALAQALASLSATTIVGGGDSVAAIQSLGLSKKFSHISTGGGASLEFLEMGHLPGIDALSPGR